MGRGADFTVALEDMTVSEHQLSVIVYDDLVTRLVPDLDAINPLVVNGRTINESVVVGPNDVVQFGATAVSFRVFSRSSDSERDQLGQVPFRRTPAKPVVVSEREFKPIGGAPMKPDKRRFPIMMMMAPDVHGRGHVRGDQEPATLMMMAMSPMMAAANYVEGRRDRSSRSTPIPVDQFPGASWTNARPRSSRRSSTSAPSASTSRPTSPTLPAGRRFARSTCGRGNASDDAFLRTRLGIGTVALAGHGRAGEPAARSTSGKRPR